MAFYDMDKGARIQLVGKIAGEIMTGIENTTPAAIRNIFDNPDTYIRKSAYTAMGNLYFQKPELQSRILAFIHQCQNDPSFFIRQTAINTAGEIGKRDFQSVQSVFDLGLFDPHHAPRNAVIGSIKKMGEVNPEPVLNWANRWIHHPDKEIRREICHGIELRGRKFPQDILPLLRELEFDETARVRNTLVHVLGQISYKRGCLQTVITDLKTWENKSLVADALEEIIDVHHRYRDFAVYSQEQAREFILNNF